MTTNTTIPGTSPAPATKSRQRARQPVGGTNLGRDASAQAKRLAAAILEVLAGVRTTTDAATAVGLSLTRYYQVENRALAGLVRACEPSPRGRQPSEQRELVTLRRTQERLQRDLARQQTLARLAQRSLGLAAPAATPVAKANGKKPRRRKPVARALQVATRLGAAPPAPPAAHPPTAQPANADSLQKPP
jgi:hypothetical protein